MLGHAENGYLGIDLWKGREENKFSRGPRLWEGLSYPEHLRLCVCAFWNLKICWRGRQGPGSECVTFMKQALEELRKSLLRTALEKPVV